MAHVTRQPKSWSARSIFGFLFVLIFLLKSNVCSYYNNVRSKMLSAVSTRICSKNLQAFINPWNYRIGSPFWCSKSSPTSTSMASANLHRQRSVGFDHSFSIRRMCVRLMPDRLANAFADNPRSVRTWYSKIFIISPEVACPPTSSLYALRAHMCDRLAGS